MTVDDRLRAGAEDLLADVRSTTDADAALRRVVTSGPSRGRWLGVAAAAAVLLVAIAVVASVDRPDGEDVTIDGTTTTGLTTPTTVAPRPETGLGAPDDGRDSANLAVTVTPSTDLAPDQTVEVAGDGFTPGEPVGVMMCTADALSSGSGSGGCDLSQVGSATVDPQGRASGTFTVRRVITTPRSGWVDCAFGEVACGIAIGQVSDYDVSGLAEVTFAALDPIPPLQLSVSPAEDLVHGQLVTVTGEGFSGAVSSGQLCAEGPSAPAEGLEGFSEPPCLFLDLADPVTGPVVAADGHFTAEVRLWRTIPLVDGPVDCAAAACSLRIDEGGRFATVPVAFDPDVPAPPAPTMSATPTTGLAVGDEVVVTVEGLAPGQELGIFGCSSFSDSRTVLEVGCPALVTLGDATADATGRAVVTVVMPSLEGYGVDCTREGACALTVADAHEAGEGGGDPSLAPQAPVVITYAS